MTTLYGIKNCDTVRKARRWLDQNNHAHTFLDFRVDGLDMATLQSWAKQIDKDLLVNKRSTTWKQLSDADKALFDGEVLDTAALETVLNNPTLLKRPILLSGKKSDKDILVGFNPERYTEIFA